MLVVVLKDRKSNVFFQIKGCKSMSRCSDVLRGKTPLDVFSQGFANLPLREAVALPLDLQIFLDGVGRLF